MEQTIENFEGTKNIILDGGGASDIQAGIEFIYNIREHSLDIAVATLYGIALYALILWINKKMK